VELELFGGVELGRLQHFHLADENVLKRIDAAGRVLDHLADGLLGAGMGKK